MTKKKKWYDYLWIVSATYLILGFFNILFAWIGLLCFFIPLLIAIFGGDKMYCNKFCGRGQLFDLLGNKLGLSRKKDIPKFLRSKWFRYGFLIFFFIMFFNMLFSTYLVFEGTRNLKEVVTLLCNHQTALELGIQWYSCRSLGRAVCLWFLQRDAHIHRLGTHYHDFV